MHLHGKNVRKLTSLIWVSWASLFRGPPTLGLQFHNDVMLASGNGTPSKQILIEPTIYLYLLSGYNLFTVRPYMGLMYSYPPRMILHSARVKAYG